MKSFEIAIFDNVNISRLKEILDGLESVGCSVKIANGRYHIEYKDELEGDVSAFFESDYSKNVKRLL